MNAYAARDPGIYEDVPIEEYHAEPGLSSTALRLLAHTPKRYWAHYLNPKRPPHRLKAGQLEGQLAHCAVLEPLEFDKRYIVIPDDAPRRPTSRQYGADAPSYRTLRDIEWWNGFDKRAGDRVAITAEQRSVAMAQAESVHGDPEASELLQVGTPELSAYWLDEETQELCKCRPDWERPIVSGSVWLADLKTFESSHPVAVARQIERKMYWLQAAWYTMGFQLAGGGRVDQFPFVFVEMEYPFDVSVHILHEDSLAYGKRRVRELMTLFAECRKANRWPGATGVNIVSLPRRLTSAT